MPGLAPFCSRWFLAAWLFAALGPLVSFTTAAEPTPTPAEAKFFEKEVQPILVGRCFKCHSHAAKKSSGGLVVDSLGGLLTGGDSGPALVRGKPKESLLVEAVRYESDYPRMPPAGKLESTEIATIERWVEMGAPWPGASTTAPARAAEKFTEADRAWWAFQPVTQPTPPEVKDSRWARNPVDRFIRSRLDREGLSPSAPADRTALVRRIYFDLVGLPPSPEEIEAFVADKSPTAYEDLVDRLLASPRYGERWARHWLDLVRYAESDGYRIDDYRPDAWRYRDYVVRAFNADKPYDRFIKEQLAGDELAPDDPEAQLATSYLRLGIYEYNNRDVRGQWSVMLNDITDVTGDVFLGLGMACARCHDHKFDPILQHDYFRLQAFFASIMPHDDLVIATAAEQSAYQHRVAPWEAKTAEIRAKLEELEGPQRAAAEKGAVDKFPDDLQEILHKPVADRTPLEKQLGALAYRQVQYEFDRLDRRFKEQAKVRLIELRKELSKFAAEQPEPLPLAMTVRDVGREAAPTMIPKKSIAPIEPGFLTLLDENPAEIVPPASLESTGRRTALANWLTRPDHPLTARVLVNRLWQYHFGRGLVATSSDFGRLGEPPSHPELLDWLADDFVRGGWSIKRMHRLLVTSQAYRQSATEPASPLALRKDPENRLVWRMSTRRLDAEQVRDALLAVTRRLDLTAGGESVDSATPRRSIYTRVLRNRRDALLDVFDSPEGFASTSQRNVTTTPAQALLMINGPFLLEQAEAFATRLLADSSAENSELIDKAIRLAWGRAATPAENAAGERFLRDQMRRIDPEANEDLAVRLGKIPFRDGNALVLDPAGPMRTAQVFETERLPKDDFTIEAFVLLRSLHEDATVRTIAARWDNSPKSTGWAFGVTSRRSQFKPQMLVLQLWGRDAAGQHQAEAVFSSLQLELNKPYFVAASVDIDNPASGGVTFFAKDLSNDDETMLSSQSEHRVVDLSDLSGPFTMGGTRADGARGWDGLLDNVRLSRAALAGEKLLYTTERVTDQTCGYWEFEPQTGIFRDTSPNQLNLRSGAKSRSTRDARTTAFIDFCHVLLNTNEFLYVD